MHCPFCNHPETKVIDSRLVSDGAQVRRRRECIQCNERYSTYEVAELVLPRIIKRDGRRVPFDHEKLRSGFHKALEKRAVSCDSTEAAIEHVIHHLRALGEREVSSNVLGELVMQALRDLDQVAYVRFASVYRQFKDVEAFHEEIMRLRKEKCE